MSPGHLGLVGGGEWTQGCSFDARLLEAAATDRVVVLPTAAAFERPERKLLAAATWFAGLGVEVEGLMVVERADAQDDAAAEVVRAARFVYLSDGSALHVRSVLRESKVFEALRAAWEDGAVVVGSGAGAAVLTDPMVDPRGGALTVGLGLVERMVVVPHFGETAEDVHGEKLHRSVLLAPPGLPLVGVPERTALLRDPEGSWDVAGEGTPVVFLDGARAAEGMRALDPG